MEFDIIFDFATLRVMQMEGYSVLAGDAAGLDDVEDGCHVREGVWGNTNRNAVPENRTWSLT